MREGCGGVCAGVRGEGAEGRGVKQGSCERLRVDARAALTPI